MTLVEEEGEIWANPDALEQVLSGLDFMKDLENQARKKNLTLEQYIKQFYPVKEENK